MDEIAITAQAPASVANMCCGFDIIAFALNEPFDQVTAKRTSDDNIVISQIANGDNLSKDPPQNIIGIVASRFFELLGKAYGVDLQLVKGMPVGTGLGSSAASAVATAVALNALFDTPFTHEQLLEVALAGETAMTGSRHADNVAAALHGGLVLVKDQEPLNIYPIPCLLDLHCVVVYPHLEILTAESRNSLAETVPLKTMVRQTTHLAGLVLGLTTGDRELIAKSLCDEVIEPQRYQQIPPYRALKAAALKLDALGCGISGSGPSMFAICDNAIQALEISNTFEQVCDDANLDSNIYISPLLCSGARVIS